MDSNEHHEITLDVGRPNALMCFVDAVKACFEYMQRTFAARPSSLPVQNCMLYRNAGCPHISRPLCTYPSCYLLRDHLVPSRKATPEELAELYGADAGTPEFKDALKSTLDDEIEARR